MTEALKLLAAEDARQAKLHELLETIREQIRLEVAPEHRPDGLFKNIQDAVYAMRGRTPLMNDAALTEPLRQPSLLQIIEDEARRYADMYQLGSDGRNTFVMFADWVNGLRHLASNGA